MTATESEDAILSCCLCYPKESLPTAASELRPEHLQTPNSDLWRAILSVFCAGHHVDFAGVMNALRDAGTMEKIGGASRISQLTVMGGVPSTIMEHIRRVRDASAARQTVQLLAENLNTLKGAKATSESIGPVLANLILGLEAIGSDRSSKKAPTTKQLVMEVVCRLQNRMDNTGAEETVSTGIKSLDRLTGGLRPGGQWVLAGPAKGGKSSLAITFLNQIAVQEGKRCAFFGLEMPSIENVERLLASVGHVDATLMRDGEMQDEDLKKTTKAAAKLSTAPILFRDDVFDLAEMIAIIRQMKSAYPDLFAVFVDYAQLIAGDKTDQNGREREIAMVSRSLRKVSMQLGLCVILLSQVNDDGKIRESRSLGMDATKVIFIEFGETSNVRVLRVVQRDGKSGETLRVAYRGQYFQFADLAEDDQQPELLEHPNARKR